MRIVPGQVWDQLPEAARRLARVPRYARLIARLPESQFEKLVDEASVYWYVHTYVSPTYGSGEDTGIIDSGLQAETARWLGFETIPAVPAHAHSASIHSPYTRRQQTRLAMAMLGAIAFEMIWPSTGTVLPEDEIGGSIRDMISGSGEVDRFRKKVKARLTNRPDAETVYCLDEPISASQFQVDWERLRAMNSHGLDHLTLSAFDEILRFNNITLQAFFAAYWVCNFATNRDREAVLTRLLYAGRDRNGKIVEMNEAYREFWNFVIQMPEEASNSVQWVQLISPIYNPDLCKSVRDKEGFPIQSTELIYKTWKRMTDLDKDVVDVFRNQFKQILACNDERAEVARGFLEYQNVATKRQVSQFLALCRKKRGLYEGEFWMGAPVYEFPEWMFNGGVESQDNPLHMVRLSHYRLHRLCVTNAAYELFDQRHKSLRAFSDMVRNLDDHPVVNVNWYDAICFARWLGEIEVDGERYLITLPSEAEWEYACRCGSEMPFTWDKFRNGTRIESGYCNFDGNHPWSLGRPVPPVDKNRRRTVRVDGLDEDDTQIPSNAWGFYQLHGNVWEWCWDWYEKNYYWLEIDGKANDPLGPDVAWGRVLRGGSWEDEGGYCRSAYRWRYAPGIRDSSTGVRLAAVPAERHEREDRAKHRHIGTQGGSVTRGP